MPRTGRPKAELTLTDEERGQLVRWARRRKSSQALALRSRVVLGCADRLDNKTVAAQLGCSAATVGKWRGRFVEHRLDGLTDEDRPGRPPVISADQVEDVVVATLESTPANATHWSRAKMAERTGLSKSTIGRIWRAFELKPHRADGFKLSNDPLFVDKVHDVVGLHLASRSGARAATAWPTAFRSPQQPPRNSTISPRPTSFHPSTERNGRTSHDNAHERQ